MKRQDWRGRECLYRDYIAYLDDAAEKRQTLSRCFLLFRELQETGIDLRPFNHDTVVQIEAGG